VLHVGKRRSSNNGSAFTEPGTTDLAKIIAQQIDNHQILGPVLRIVKQ
jgi:hypothetical protein